MGQENKYQMRDWIDLFESRFSPTSGIINDDGMTDLRQPKDKSKMMGRETGVMKPEGNPKPQTPNPKPQTPYNAYFYVISCFIIRPIQTL